MQVNMKELNLLTFSLMQCNFRNSAYKPFCPPASRSPTRPVLLTHFPLTSHVATFTMKSWHRLKLNKPIVPCLDAVASRRRGKSQPYPSSVAEPAVPLSFVFFFLLSFHVSSPPPLHFFTLSASYLFPPSTPLFPAADSQLLCACAFSFTLSLFFLLLVVLEM